MPVDFEQLVVHVGEHDVSPSAIAKAEGLEEAAAFLESAKQIRVNEIFRGCFGREEFGDGWEGLSLGEKKILRSAAAILRKMAARYRGVRKDEAA
jgi:hypothetical protein